MNIVNKLTLNHLKSNLKRTVVTILGMIVSVAMITATCVSIASIFDLLENQDKYTQGLAHAVIDSGSTKEDVTPISPEQMKTLAESDGVQSAAAVKYAEGFHIENQKHPARGIGSIGAMNDAAFKMFIVGKLQGSLPQNSSEILVDKEFVEKNNLNWKVGDTVQIVTGTRVIPGDDGSEITIPFGTAQAGETLQDQTVKSYKITGFISSNLPTEGYRFDFPILRGMENSESADRAFLLMQDTTKKSAQQAEAAIKNAGIQFDITMLDSSLFAYHMVMVNDTGMMSTLFMFAAIIFAVIIVASVMLIYNAFGISLSERTRYLGMLATVGATKKQKRQSVYFEGFLLGIISIPLGIVFGILGIDITLRLLSPYIASFMNSLTESGYTAHAVVPIWAIVVIVVLSAFTIFISSLIPAAKASRTTPIDALRQTDEIKVKAKKLHVPKIVRKLFGYEGELAMKNLKRNGKKSRTITASLAISIVLFICVNAFCTMFTAANSSQTTIPYQVSAILTEGKKQDMDKLIAATEKVDRSYSVTTASDLWNVNGKYINEDSIKLYNTGAESDTYNVDAVIWLLDDDMFDALCVQNGINSSDYYGKDGARSILLRNELVQIENNKKTIVHPLSKDVVGQTLQSNVPFIQEDGTEIARSYKIGAILSNTTKDTQYLYDAGTLNAYMPISAANDFELSMYSVGIETKDASAVADSLEEALADNTNLSANVVNIKGNVQQMRSTIMVMQVFAYGFIALITLVSVFNIFNTITTSIELRRKEFAMYKSIGITPHGFTRMINFESLFYGLKALLFGLPLSIAISYLMNRVLGNSVAMPFTLDWRIYLGTVVAVFLIVGLSMLFSWSKLRKDSIIETLKTEIN